MTGSRVLQLFFLLPPLLTPTNPATLSPWPVSCPAKCRCGVQKLPLLDGISLRNVNCSNLELLTVPHGIPPDTEALALNSNNLTDLYGQLPPLPNLKYLDLSKNHIKQLGRGVIFHNFTQLKVLNLSFNDFRTVFNGVFRGIYNLRHLTMTHVQIKYIEEHVFDGLQELRILYLSNNQLNAIFPEWFQELPQLEELNMEYNHIAYVNSGSFASLKSLKQLSLSNNKIRGISEQALSGLENLVTLDMENNQLNKVPSASFQATKNVKVLKLGSNSFTQLHTGDFVNLSMEEVSIENIEDLTLVDRGAFWDLPNLRVLHLHRNPRLHYIDTQAFIKVPNLQRLFLHKNNLSALSKEVIDSFGQPVEVSLYDNPLLCDCNIRWIQEILNSTNQSSQVTMVYSERMKCDRPKDVSEVLVKDLQSTQIPDRCPPVLVGLVNNTVDKKIGDKHIFQCHAHGIPPPKIHWVLPSGAVLNGSSNDIHVQLKHPGSLSIYHLKPKDTGTYICVAENSLGEATSVTDLIVDNIDINIFPLSVAATFITVVWNGTARNSFPEYQIVYREENGRKENQSVTVSQFLRSYTINNLRPQSTYRFCIGFKNKEDEQYVQFSCTSARTRDESFMLQGIHRTSNVAMAVVLGIITSMLMVVCVVTVAARKYRQRHYDTPEKSLVCNMAQIPMENLHSPLMSHAGS